MKEYFSSVDCPPTTKMIAKKLGYTSHAIAVHCRKLVEFGFMKGGGQNKPFELTERGWFRVYFNDLSLMDFVDRRLIV